MKIKKDWRYYTSLEASMAFSLGILFVVLKLLNVTAWEWWQACLPFIIEFSIAILFLFLYLIVVLEEEFSKYK
jgi:hypothetical protein